MYRYRYHTYGTSKYARAMPKILQASADIGTAVGSGLVFAGKGLYDTFSKNKILAKDKAMPYKRTFKRSKRSSKRSYKKRQFKGTRSKKPKRSYRRKTSLKKEVKQIKRQLNADSAHHVYKLLTGDKLLTAVNQSNYATFEVITGTLLEAYMANLRYYDPATPGTLVTASGATGSYQREIFFKNVNGIIELRNNYQVPVKVKVYLVKPKGDTTITPTTYYNNAIADQLIGGAGSITTNGVYPTDLAPFMAQWRIKCVKDVVLDSGATVVASHNSGSFKYDPSLFDSHALEYQTKFKSFAWFVRVEGIIGHDTSVATEQTTLAGGVDVLQTIRVEIIYDAGVILDDLYVNNLRDASFTNGGVVASKPVSDNISYSVA